MPPPQRPADWSAHKHHCHSRVPRLPGPTAHAPTRARQSADNGHHPASHALTCSHVAACSAAHATACLPRHTAIPEIITEPGKTEGKDRSSGKQGPVPGVGISKGCDHAPPPGGHRRAPAALASAASAAAARTVAVAPAGAREGRVLSGCARGGGLEFAPAAARFSCIAAACAKSAVPDVARQRRAHGLCAVAGVGRDGPRARRAGRAAPSQRRASAQRAAAGARRLRPAAALSASLRAPRTADHTFYWSASFPVPGDGGGREEGRPERRLERRTGAVMNVR